MLPNNTNNPSRKDDRSHRVTDPYLPAALCMPEPPLPSNISVDLDWLHSRAGTHIIHEYGFLVSQPYH